MNEKKTAIPFIAIASLVLGFSLGVVAFGILSTSGLFTTSTNSTSNSASNTGQFSVLNQTLTEQIYRNILEKYIGNIPADEDFEDGLAKGLVSALQDQYASYLNSSETAQYMESRNPDFEGIGITLRFNGENTEVESVLEGNPAEKAGIMSGDIISKINSKNFLGNNPSTVASNIRGPKGSEVVLEIIRLENNEYITKEISIVRDKIEVENISFKDLGNGIFKIDISQFIDTDPFVFNSNWDDVVAQILNLNAAPSGIVLDLRNNPGGYVYSVRYVAEEFLENGEIIMMEETRQADRQVYKDFRKGRLESIPLVVLINEGSASASEIFAAAMQDNQRAAIVGMPSVGKGVEQEVISDLYGGGTLILPFQKWLTPSGNNISSESPIKPDTLVELDIEKFQKEKFDSQMEAALDAL